MGLGNVSVTLRWQAPQIDFQNSLTEVSQYKITAVQKTFMVPDVIVTLGASGTEYTVESLEEYVSYNCTVQAQNSFGIGPESNSVQFTTLQAGTSHLILYAMPTHRVTNSVFHCMVINTYPTYSLLAPSAPPQNVSVVALSPTKIQIAWSPPPAIDTNGVLIFYDVTVMELETGQQWELSSTQQQLNVTSLHPYYSYQCTVAAFTVSRGTYSSAYQAQTFETCK